MTEDQFQAKCWQWVWNNYPETRHCLWAVPNGGERTLEVAVKLKATGVLSGVHDMHFLWDGQFYTFEFKVGNNHLTKTTITTSPGGGRRVVYGQEEWGASMYAQGGVWFEVRPSDPPQDALFDFQILFERVMCGRYKRCEIIGKENGAPMF